MTHILIIAWRNIWRNPQRSIMMVLAITVGLWGGLIAASIVNGLVKQRFETSIESTISHLQIHHPDFLRDQSMNHTIDSGKELFDLLANDPAVKGFAGRTIVRGMLATANMATGVQMIGIDPCMESMTTTIKDCIIDGSYFEEAYPHPVIIGNSLAEKVKAGVGSRVVLTFQDKHNELIAASFRVAGIFQTANTYWDEQHIYMIGEELNAFVGFEQALHEVAVLLKDYRLANERAEHYRAIHPDLQIRTWAEVSPELGFLHEMASIMMMVLLMVILMALAFGLLNTMLMAVTERVQELGMLMAIGMKKTQVFLLIVFETTLLSLAGAITGMTVASITVSLLSTKGIDLAIAGGDSLHDLGFSSVVYPFIEPSFLFGLTMMVTITAILTAIYPALKILKKKPAEAVNET